MKNSARSKSFAKRVLIHSLAYSALSLSAISFTACNSMPDTPDSAIAVSDAAIFPIEKVLEIVAKENDIARTLYTSGIVGPGKKNGLKFDEDWRKDDVEAGPLPALFLRSTSSFIQRGTVPLGLYLGSDFPVNSANKFMGKQAELFEEIKKDEKPKFFYDEETELYTAMFPDFASAMPCVSCHNDHEQSPKKDWKLGDVMGATTWTYPKEKLTYEEAKEIINVYRSGIVNTFEEYIKEINSFKTSEKPEIGTTWPNKGYFIPEPMVFLDSVKTLASTQTLDALLAN